MNEKISIEEVIDESIFDWSAWVDEDYDPEWTKYVASLCKSCGAEPGETHCCGDVNE